MDLGEAFPAVDVEPSVTLPKFDELPGAGDEFVFDMWQTWSDPLAHANHPDYIGWCDEATSRRMVASGVEPTRLRPIAEQVTFRLSVLPGEQVTVRTKRIGTIGTDAVVLMHTPGNRTGHRCRCDDRTRSCRWEQCGSHLGLGLIDVYDHRSPPDWMTGARRSSHRTATSSTTAPRLVPRCCVPSPLIVGGRDEREGGTWFGLARGGLFVGLTNQRSFGTRDDSLRSRGGLVLDALAEESLEGVTRYLSRVDPATYNDFNLIFGDGDRLCAAYGRRGAHEVELKTLGKGVHVLCNDRLGSPDFPKADRARERVMSVPAGQLAAYQAAARRSACGRLASGPVESSARSPGGTVRSGGRALPPGDLRENSRVRHRFVDDRGSEPRPRAPVIAFAEGRPSETSFKDVLHLTRGAPDEFDCRSGFPGG